MWEVTDGVQNFAETALRRDHLGFVNINWRMILTFSSLAVTLHTTRFNIKKFYVVPTLRLCVLYGSQNKQKLLPYKTLRDWFL
jgi:hypothetical protein